MLDAIALLNDEDKQVLSIDPFQSSNKDKGFSELDVVYRYVLEKFKEDITSGEAASLACLNEAAFCRYFKRQTGKTFSQFVSHVRVTHATFLLRETQAGITDICYDCGFNNLSYFNRQFKLYTNRSPLQYRKEGLRSHAG